MDTPEELRKRFGHGYEVLIGQDVAKAKDLVDYLIGVRPDGAWWETDYDSACYADQAVDLRMFVQPGLYSPNEDRFIPAYRLTLREGDSMASICIPWESRRALDSNMFEVLYGSRFVLMPRNDYRDFDIPERNCGDDFDDGC